MNLSICNLTGQNEVELLKIVFDNSRNLLYDHFSYEKEKHIYFIGSEFI